MRRIRVAKYSLSFLFDFYHVRIYISETRIRDGCLIETGQRSNSRCCVSPLIIHNFFVAFSSLLSPYCDGSDIFLSNPIRKRNDDRTTRNNTRFLGKFQDELQRVYRIFDRDESETVSDNSNFWS